MNQEGGTRLSTFQVDGGMANSDPLMQMQADILGINVVRPSMLETSSLGAAMAAGSAAGIDVWDLNADDNNTDTSDIFKPKISLEGILD